MFATFWRKQNGLVPPNLKSQLLKGLLGLQTTRTILLIIYILYIVLYCFFRFIFYCIVTVGTCLALQLASGAFGHIKDTVLSALNREPTTDISPETVGTLSLIMLAQAQEVIFLKATSGTNKKGRAKITQTIPKILLWSRTHSFFPLLMFTSAVSNCDAFCRKTCFFIYFICSFIHGSAQHFLIFSTGIRKMWYKWDIRKQG